MAASAALILVLVLVVLLVCAALRLFCASGAQLEGYWSTPQGALFEVRVQPGGGFSASTASKFLDAEPGRAYPVVRRGCRGAAIAFPSGALRGRVGLDRRRIIWDGSPTWFRQGV